MRQQVKSFQGLFKEQILKTAEKMNDPIGFTIELSVSRESLAISPAKRESRLNYERVG